MWEALLMVGYWSGEIWNRRKTKEVFSGWVSISAVKDTRGKITHYIGIFTDNTNQKRTEERLYHLAHYDALTDLPNRALFQERIEQAIKRAARENHWVVLLLIDLDRFKAVNDSFGHKAGDELLAVVSRRLLDCLQGDKDALARFGGDEFAILLADLPAKAALQAASDRSEEAHKRIQEVCPLQDQEIFITASVGVAFFPQDGMNASELFKNADTAMYKAKELGRNGTQFYAPAMNLAVHKRLTLQNSLRRALEREELQLLYQPQLSVPDRRIIGVEALLRWSHPTLGPVSPAEFIPLAEDCGLIAPIGEWVLHTACAQNKAWQDAGARPVRMAVNLSVRQFYNENLQPMLKRVLQDTGLEPSLLELEITESVAMSCAGNTVCALQNLKQIGLNLAIDDFGTGYSSLNYLKQFTIDTLKIDASFVRDISSRSGAALIQAMIQMAHSLYMSIVAEGVETEQQFAFLEANGCDMVQGFLFYKPMPASEVMKLLLPARHIH
jgi:diguanylate cyclase (GGDEF)-like protein